MANVYRYLARLSAQNVVKLVLLPCNNHLEEEENEMMYVQIPYLHKDQQKSLL